MEVKGNNFKAMQVLHRALLLGVFLFGIVIIFVRRVSKFEGVQTSTDKILQVTVLVLAALGIWIGFTLFNKRISSLPATASPKEKMSVYLSASIIRWALIEGPAFFAMIGFFITGNFAFFALGLTILIVLAVLGPSKINIARQLQISEKEIEEA